jgi:hypothetical protein
MAPYAQRRRAAPFALRLRFPALAFADDTSSSPPALSLSAVGAVDAVGAVGATAWHAS